MHWPEIRQVLQKVLTIDIYSCRNRSCILLFWLLNSAQLTRKSGYSNRVAWTMRNSNSKAIVHCRISSLVATCFRNALPLSQALRTHPLAISSVVHPSPLPGGRLDPYLWCTATADQKQIFPGSTRGLLIPCPMLSEEWETGKWGMAQFWVSCGVLEECPW